MQSAALRLADIGWYVFPCNPKTKAPLTPTGFKEATLDTDVIVAWWSKHPTATVGVACGASGICAVDIDNQDTWRKLIKYHPNTVEQSTPSGGRHLIFRGDVLKHGTNVGGHKGIDVRGSGGYIIVAPSAGYTWLPNQSPFDIVPAEAPSWLVEALGAESKPLSAGGSGFVIPSEIVEGQRDDMIFKSACSMFSRNDLSFDMILSAMLTYNAEHCVPPLSESIVTEKVKSAQTYNGPVGVKIDEKMVWDYKRGKKKELACTVRNVLNFIRMDEELRYCFKFNLFSNHIEVVRAESWMHDVHLGYGFDDDNLACLRMHILRNHKVEFTLGIVNEAVTIFALENTFHPVRNYLNGLKWDGVPRMDSWLVDYCNAENSKYNREVGRLFLLGACSRILKPGCKFDYMVILEGDQGIGKSRLLQALGGEWSAEISLMSRTKDTIDVMMGRWIVEVAEMATFKKQEIESLKSFITTTTDRVRLAYARRVKDYPRQCVFCCTLNPDLVGYLIDSTGNRRFLPVFVKDIDVVGVQMARDQLWAEAWQACQKPGTSLYIEDKEVMKEVSDQQKLREQIDGIQTVIEEWLNRNNLDCLTGYKIYKELFNRGEDGDFPPTLQRRIGKAMQRLGWDKRSVRVDGNVVKCYVSNSFNDYRD